MFSYQIDEELQLRLYDQRDAETMHEVIVRNRQYLNKWLPWAGVQQSADDSRAFIRRNLVQYGEDNGFAAGIWYKGELVGGIGFHYWDFHNSKTEIGYWLAEDAQGKGIMTRAVKTLIDYAFNVLKLNRVEIRAATENMKSRAVPERLGFKLDGILRRQSWLHDRFVDHAVYSLLRGEWGR